MVIVIGSQGRYVLIDFIIKQTKEYNCVRRDNQDIQNKIRKK